jgi:hypothetical protein
MGASLYRELTDRLKAAGCEFVREGIPRNIVSRILATAILKQAGLD